MATDTLKLAGLFLPFFFQLQYFFQNQINQLSAVQASDEEPFATMQFIQQGLIVVTYSGLRATIDSFNAYLEAREGSYAHGPIAVIFDARHSKPLQFKFQEMQAAWIKKHSKMIDKSCICQAYVLPNEIAARTLDTIFAMQKTKTPYKSFQDFDEAKSWALALMATSKK